MSRMNLKSITLGLVAVAGLALSSMLVTACGVPTCAGTNCVCPQGMNCAFDGCTAGTAGCNFACGQDASCTGSCGANCNVGCSGKSCTHTVGAGSNIACTAGTCNITCEGACSAVGVTNLTCKSGTKTAGGCS